MKQEILRVDYNMSDKARMWFRASGFSSDNTGLTSPAINNQWGLANVDYQQTMPNLGANLTYIFSPTLVNEATFGMNLWTERSDPEQVRAGSLPAKYLWHQHTAKLSHG